MFFLTYVSSSTTPFSQAELVGLLLNFRENNQKRGISGMLLYKDGNFMQVLEGSKAEVLALHQKIELDPRHSGIITLLEGESNARQFSDWSMGFQDLMADGVLDDFPGYSEFLDVSLTAEEFFADPGKCQKLLMTFKNSM